MEEKIDTSPTDPPTPVTYELPIKEPSGKKKTWLFVLLAVLVVIAIGCTVFYFMTRNSTIEKSGEQSTSPVTFSSVPDLLSNATANVKGYQVELSATDGLGGTTSDGYMAYTTAPFRASESDPYFTMPFKSMGAAYRSDSSTAAADYTAMVDFFNKNKSTLLDEGEHLTNLIKLDGESASYIAYTVYKTGNTVCKVQHVDATRTSLNAHIAGIGCGDIASYNEAHKAFEPFYAAYSKGKTFNYKPVFGLIAKGDGADDYEHATFYQIDYNASNNGSFEGLYYKKKSDKDWTYFAGFDNQKAIACDKFTTDIVKKGFANTTCYTGDTKETVTP